jgi:Protein of unknown function (DUF3551)
MRWPLWLMPVCLAASTLAPSPAVAVDYPFCITGGEFGGSVGDCSFSTYAQCLASASGRDAGCAANPFFNSGPTVRPDRGLRPRRSF